jgi:hypothetical protein
MPDFANSVSTRSSRVNIRLVSTAIALVASAMLLGAGVYESVVVAPNFHGAPPSLQHAPGFCHATNPGMLFRVLSPALQLSLPLALLCNWRPVAATRWRLAAALALAIVSDVIPFAFHYPRNTILFSASLTATPADLDRVATEWVMGNRVRIAVVLPTVILVIASLVRISRDSAPARTK